MNGDKMAEKKCKKFITLRPTFTVSVPERRPMPINKYQGHIGAWYVLGGCNVSGCHLFEIHSHGLTGKMPFTSSGSGALSAMAVLESSWRDGMTETEAVEFVK
ncbi:hypothetical protein ACA910_018541 [Epithemia clementina (nom. ined.)]